MHVSRKADYAVRAMSYLASRPTQRELVLIADVAEAMSVPQAFLSKIMRELVDSGLVVSQAGRSGGYRLSRRAEEISFRDIVEAVEGPLTMVPCQGEDADPCTLGDRCAQVPIWDRIRVRMLEVFAEYTLDQVTPQAAVDAQIVQLRAR